jgi:alpha-1,6-mannosyltransferase
MNGRIRIWIHVAGALSLAGWVVLALASHLVERPLALFLGTMIWEWLIFVAIWRVVLRDNSNLLLRPILGWAISFLVCGLLAVPLMEDDPFRFLWDGRQFAITGNPYIAPPSASFGDAGVPERFQEILDQINYPQVPTIYGPVCQVGFLFSYLAAPGQLWPWKLLVLAAQLALMVVVIALLRQKRIEKTGCSTPTVAGGTLMVGWCPLLVFETGFNAHPDVFGVMLITAALLGRLRGKLGWCGVFCGFAIAAKVFAVLLVPFLLGRSRKAWVFCLGMVVVCYAPFWMQGSLADLAGLTAFLSDWEFNSSFYAIARSRLDPPLARGICGSLFLLGWSLLFFRYLGKNRPVIASEIPPGTAILGMFFLLSATVNPWYLLWLAPFVASRPDAAGVTAMAMVSLSYVTGLNLGDPGLQNFAHPAWLRPLEYGGIALALIVDWRRSRGERRQPSPLPEATLPSSAPQMGK